MSDQPPTTYGWDVVLATRTSIVNAGLAHPDPQPFVEEVVRGSTTVTVRGECGPWQVTAGGSGALVNFTVACPTITLSDGTTAKTFTDGSFLVQASLRFGSEDAAGRVPLVIATGSPRVLDATFPEHGFEPFAAYALAALQSWLGTQNSFPYVLATASLAGAGVTPGTASALLPTSVSYGYCDILDGDGALGVLATVAGGAGRSGLLQEVDPSAVARKDIALLVDATVLSHLAEAAAGAILPVGVVAATCPVSDGWCLPVSVSGPTT